MTLIKCKLNKKFKNKIDKAYKKYSTQSEKVNKMDWNRPVSDMLPTGMWCKECKKKKESADIVYNIIRNFCTIQSEIHTFARLKIYFSMRYSLVCKKCGVNHQKYTIQIPTNNKPQYGDLP